MATNLYSKQSILLVLRFNHLKKYSLILLIGFLSESLGVFLWYMNHPEQIFTWGLIILPIACFPFVCISSYRDLKIRKGVTQYSQNACPKCEHDFTHNHKCCHRRPNSWSNNDVKEFWNDYTLNPFNAVAIQRGNPPQAASWWIQNSRSAAIFFFFAAGLAAFSSVSLFAIYPALIMSESKIILIPCYLLVAGMFLYVISGHTYSNEVVCPKCSHSLPPHLQEGTCTECGTLIPKPSKFHPKKYKIPVVLYIALFAPILFLQLWNIAYRYGLNDAIAPSLTNNALIILAAENGRDDAIWDEVSKRTFTNEENTQLADLVISNRTRETSWVYGRSKNWLVNQFNAQKLSPQSLNDLRLTYWVPEVILPEKIITGKPFSVVVQGQSFPGMNGPLVGTVICYEGVSIDGGPYQGQEERGIWTMEASVNPNQSYSRFNTTITIDTPGTHTIRVKYWLMDRRFERFNDLLPRDEENRLTLPPDATWMIPVTIDTEVTVQN